MLDLSTQSRRVNLKVRKDDLYETPSCAVESLLKIESLTSPIWECACGPGAIVDVLTKRGYSVRATDLVDYKCGESRIDFLMETQCWNGTILTNPPYKLAPAFARKATALCSLVIMLMRLSFLEGTSRSDVLYKLSRVHVFSRRLPRMHRGGRFYQGKEATSSIPFAWFVWDAHCCGPTILTWIDWKN